MLDQKIANFTYLRPFGPIAFTGLKAVLVFHPLIASNFMFTHIRHFFTECFTVNTMHDRLKQ